MIGDPKPDSERVLSSEAEVQERVKKLEQQAKKLLGDNTIEFVNNYDWLKDVTLLTFLRDIGKHFTVNELIKKDAIATRLQNETGLSYTEFAYPLLQAYDYLKLCEEKNCSLQVGGSDQWGNLIAGVDLVRRVKQKTVHALTVPLVIDKITGKKFGKSEGNAVWLSAEKTSPFSFYQFWLNTADENVIGYLKLYTLLSREEITELEAELQSVPGGRRAQKALAGAVTALVHGEEVSEQVAKASECLFGNINLSELPPEDLKQILSCVPQTGFAASVPLVEVMVITGLASSKREARTFIESGAVSINDQKISDVEAVTTILNGEVQLLRRGKRSVALIQVL